MSDVLPLSDLQVRILGCLIEKKATTPDQYPLTLNALRNACNQKSNRFPVTNYETGEIGHALRELSDKKLVRMERSARAERYEHRTHLVLDLKPRDVAVLSTLMLRGPQTLAELKARTYNVLGLDDLDSVQAVIQRLAERDIPLAQQIPRQAGQREDRFVHLLAGEPDLSSLPPPVSASRGHNSELESRLQQVESELAELRAMVEHLMQNPNTP